MQHRQRIRDIRDVGRIGVGAICNACAGGGPCVFRCRATVGRRLGRVRHRGVDRSGWVCHRAPYLADTGGRVRARHCLRIRSPVKGRSSFRRMRPGREGWRQEHPGAARRRQTRRTRAQRRTASRQPQCIRGRTTRHEAAGTGQNRNAHDFRRIPNVDSAGTCSLQCAMDSQCRAMTYLTDDKTCWMKDETGSPQAGSQATSAVKRVNPLAQTLAPPR